MNANKNLGKKRKIAIVMVVLGAMYMSVYIEAVLEPHFFAHEFNPFFPGQDLPINLPSILAFIYSGPFDSEKLTLVLGFIMFLIGMLSLLSLLIGRLTNGKIIDYAMSYPHIASFCDAFRRCDMDANEHFAKKRKYAIAIIKWGTVIMSMGVIPYLYIYPLLFKPNIPDIIVGITVMYIFISEPLFVSGFILLLIGLLVGLIGRLKKQESL